jgi:hypothetical protein
LAKNASFFCLKEHVLTEYKKSEETTRFGYFDIFPSKERYNSSLLTYLEILQTLGKTTIEILLVKDFVPKQSEVMQHPKHSLFCTARLETLLFRERVFETVEERHFNLKELMDEKEYNNFIGGCRTRRWT